MSRALRLVPLFALSFLLCSAAFRALLPVPADGGLAAKLAAWEACRDRVDTVFLGSSRVAHGVVPAEFDAVMAARGRPTHSFNLGVDGMGTLETDALLRALLSDPPAGLDSVFIELDAWRPAAVSDRSLWTVREIRWHDLDHLRIALHSIRLGEAMWPLKLQAARVHVEHFLMRALNLGLGRAALRQALLPPPAGTPTVAELLATAGFQPFPARDAGGPVFRGDLQAYLAAVERAVARDSTERALELYNMRALTEQVARVRAAGLTPVHFVTPSVRALPFVDPLEASGLLPDLLAFHRPASHPELFAPAARYDDGGHLNEDGARAFTRRLAEAWADRPAPDGR